jgi:hypothetical protein
LRCKGYELSWDPDENRFFVVVLPQRFKLGLCVIGNNQVGAPSDLHWHVLEAHIADPIGTRVWFASFPHRIPQLEFSYADTCSPKIGLGEISSLMVGKYRYPKRRCLRGVQSIVVT